MAAKKMLKFGGEGLRKGQHTWTERQTQVKGAQGNIEQREPGDYVDPDTIKNVDGYLSRHQAELVDVSVDEDGNVIPENQAGAGDDTPEQPTTETAASSFVATPVRPPVNDGF